MIGAIIGDIVGSVYEFDNVRTKDFPLLRAESAYTDDSLMTVAVARAAAHACEGQNAFQAGVISEMRKIARLYPCPMGGYGARFAQWLYSPAPEPYESYGNGSAMRVSPCAEAAASLDMALDLARQSAQVTHNHPEGIKGAQATAAAVYLARTGEGKAEIRAYVQARFYPLNRTVDEIRPLYRFDETCQGTVPQAITAFLESENFEDALRIAISLGGDSDTLASITCAIAWPFYAKNGLDDVMTQLRDRAMEILPEKLRETVAGWERRFCGQAD